MRVCRAAVVAALALAVAIGGAVLGPSTGDGTPGMVVGDTVAADLTALAGDIYATFVAAAPGLGDCVRGPRLEAAGELADLAVYDQATHTMWLRVPATAASLATSMVHELAHHLELSCPSHVALRSRFLAAQQTDLGAAWFGGDVWATIPSEQFAEAVVAAVLGERRRQKLRVRLNAEAVAVVAGWLAAGE